MSNDDFSSMWAFWRRIPITARLAGFLVFLLVSLEVYARSGGGQHYSGGGGFSGSGGGGDGIGFLIWLIIVNPEIGVPVAVVVIAIGAFKHLRNPDRTTSQAVRALEKPVRYRDDLSIVTNRDSQFDSKQFLDRVKETELKVQEAWCRGDMGPVRRLLSDGLFRRFETQLKIMAAHSVRNGMADHRILDARIYGVESDAHYETIHVAIEASARDVEVSSSLSQEKAVAAAKKAPDQAYVEIWSFLRKPGAATRVEGGAIEGRCPNCGGTSIRVKR